MTRRRRRQGTFQSSRLKSKTKFNIPFLDRGRPSSPYTRESRWWIQQHEPLPPFGDGYKTLHRRGPDALAQMREEQLPQSIYCLANQPPGPEPPEDAPWLEIEIVEELRSFLTPGSHVVVCRIVSGSRDILSPSASSKSSSVLAPSCSSAERLVVAKIFDPLYYYHNGDFDIAELADMEYCREAAAYRHLAEEGVDGTLLPGYLGSFTLEVPLTDEQSYFLAQYKGADHHLLQRWSPSSSCVPVRRVRLILMERVEGQSMTSQLVFGDVNSLPGATRLDVIASTLEAYAQLYFHGIVHGDLAPRNVFLRDGTDEKSENNAEKNGENVSHYSDGTCGGGAAANAVAEKTLRFHRFVDLGLAYVLGHPESANPRQSADEVRPRNPIRLFWHVFESGAVNMYYWLPKDMRSTEAFQRWMLRRWYGDTRFESVGAVPMLVTDDITWDTGDAITNETWPEGDGRKENKRGAEDDDDDDDDDKGTKEKTEGWQFQDMMSKAMASITGIKVVGGRQQHPAGGAPPDTESAAAHVDIDSAIPPPPAALLAKESSKDLPQGFW